MSHADRLLRTPATFRRLTGLTPAAFHRLLGEVAVAEVAARDRRAARPDRRRRAGGGRTPALPPGDRLLLLLIYYRTSVPHTLLGFLFGLDDSNVSRGIRRLEPLFAGIFRIPERKGTLAPDEVRELFFDSTERPTARPARGQKRYYSGKTRRHTPKTQVVVVRVRKKPGRGPRQRRRVRIAAVSPTLPGSVHDKKVFDRTGVVIPPGAKGCGDTAYLGTGLKTPRRKPRGEALTGRQKAGNRRVSRKSIAVEHLFAGLMAVRRAFYRYPVKVDDLLSRSFPGPGGVEAFRKMVPTTSASTASGLPPRTTTAWGSRSRW